MKQLFVLLISIYFVAGCTSASGEYVIIPPDRALVFICAAGSPIQEGVTGFWEADVGSVEFGKSMLADYSRLNGAQFLPGKRIRFQVVGLKRGEELLLWFNCFPEWVGSEGWRNEGWRDSPYVVRDGGPVYWRCVFSLKQKRFIGIELNPK